MRLLFVMLSMVIMFSCKKHVCKEPVAKNATCLNATVRWTGHPAADGLGWIIFLENGKSEKPLNLADNFKTDSLAISVCYEETDEKFYCFCASPGYVKLVKIVSINKR